MFLVILIVALLKPALISTEIQLSPGTNSIITEHVPYIVSIRNSAGVHICIGAIVREYIILAPAHCIVGRADHIVAGANPETQTRKILGQILNVGYRNDIYMVLYFLKDSSLDFTSTVQRIRIYRKIPEPGDAAIISGFVKINGKTQLRSSEIHISENEQCREKLYDPREAWKLTCPIMEKESLCGVLERTSLLTCWSAENQTYDLCGLYLSSRESPFVCEDNEVTGLVAPHFAMTFAFQSWIDKHVPRA